MVVSLIGPAQHPYVQRVLLVAAYAGVSLKLVNLTADDIHALAQEASASDTASANSPTGAARRRLGAAPPPPLTRADLLRLNCCPLLTFPILKTDEGYMFDYGSIIRYLCRVEVQLNALERLSESPGAGQRAPSPGGSDGKKKYPHPQYPVLYAMYGHTLAESALVDSWIDYAATRLDFYFSDVHQPQHRKNHLRDGGDPATAAAEREALLAALEGVELRLATIRDGRLSALRAATIAAASADTNTTNATHTNNNGGMADAATAALNDYDEFLEDLQTLSSARAGGRLPSVYNVAGTIKQRFNQLSADHEAAPSSSANDNNHNNTNNVSTPKRSTQPLVTSATGLTPRASARYPLIGAAAGGGGSGGAAALQFLKSLKKDLYFLVGESLTAADLTVAMALYLIFQPGHGGGEAFLQFDAAESLSRDDLALYPYCVDYYKNILSLPVASDIRRALGITL
ncbi:elongation factor 1-gamma (EF-1-gamma) [Strigomonas culicis]|uniref:Elongation factor 1-gamma (EF-1-gamma) n=1 Tax=Strigomonas culicis TaxID=28005 RepID=S9TWT0_9TRYP|nr:elongation factor 1-gamma (EF-1-gamma) [Strigomonas culicis]EPY23762.1 elongation factor 1-gamma (EF-1-gamma) [Strigomonas culicis]|eukprot:EPY21063.1 elongation factor 1-gamma (EF-1-gamma) [Strigomonas culicis]